MSDERLEEGQELALDWDKLGKVAQVKGILPVVVQEADTHAVLILAYANEEALKESLARGIAVFWSTSRNELWVKGETSGNTLELIDVRVNCEQNSLLYRVRIQDGQGSCHTKTAEGNARYGCYYRKLSADGKLLHAGDEGRIA